MMARMRIQLMDGSPEGQTLYTGDDVKVFPREFEIIRIIGKDEDYVVIEQGVWHVFEGQTDSVTVLVKSRQKWMEEQVREVDPEEEPVESKSGSNRATGRK